MNETIVTAVSVGGLCLALLALILVFRTSRYVRRAADNATVSDGRLAAPDAEKASVDARLARMSGSPTQSADRGPETAAPDPAGGVPAPITSRTSDSLVDATTGLASPRAWKLVLELEDNRFLRYGHPATVVVMELDGLDALMAALGQHAADRLILPVAATLRLNARVADTLARTGYSHFLALLPETDEIAAIAYVDRVRTACDTWLESGEVSVRLAIGWAQVTSGGHLSDAVYLAEKRMNADRRHGRRPVPGPQSPLDDAGEESNEKIAAG